MPFFCSLVAATAATGALAVPLPAHHDALQVPCPEPASAGQESPPGPAAGEIAGFGLAAAPSQLEDARGGTDTTTNTMNVNGTVGGNTATNVVTGTNTISAGAFTDAAGIPMVIQNTGSNVLIQNATIINVRME